MQRHKKFSSIGNTVNPKKPYITKQRKINQIIFHCTATTTGRDVTAEDVDKMHITAWGLNSGCGYHFLIDIHGKVKKGRWSDYPGSHAGPNKKTGRPSSNSDTIAVVYAGGLDKNLKALDEGMNELQRRTSVILLDALMRGYELDYVNILGHSELPLVNKSCPCTDMHQLRHEVHDVNY